MSSDVFWDSNDVNGPGVRVVIDFGEEPHVPLVLLVDRSHSMICHDHIETVNKCLQTFRNDILADPLARKRLDLCVISFNNQCQVESEFGSVENFEPPELIARGGTSMGQAIRSGLDTLRARMQLYRKDGIDCYRPWVILITDGLPTDMIPGDERWNATRELILDGETNKRFMFFGVAVTPEAIPALQQLGAQRTPLLIREGKIPAMFKWLSASFSSISRSHPGGPVTDITEPTDPSSGWADFPSM